MGAMGILTGLIGTAFSVVLWIHHYQPDTEILGSYSAQIAYGGALADQLRMLAAVFGALGVIAGIGAGLGGRGSSTTVTSLLLGIAALSYPVLTWVNAVQRYVPNPVGG